MVLVKNQNVNLKWQQWEISGRQINRSDCLYPKEELCWVMPEKEREMCKCQPLVMKHQGLLLGHHSWKRLLLANSVFFSLLYPCCGH